MRDLTHIFARLLKDRKAATAVEYGLILTLVVLALLVGLTSLGVTTSGLWGDINVKVRSVS